MDKNLIELINQIQDAFSTVGGEHLDLPQIITVGEQSSGKSSVLENIVQLDFLPRGNGIVTRRPLVLQLVTLPPDKTDYAEFLHLPNKKFYDLSQLCSEIEKETDRIAGQNKGISRKPIHLKIYSKKVLNLTLIDLPGLTKIPIGDQPADIDKQIRTLVLDFISKPNSIILAVTPANSDLANSDSLKLARQVDPAGKRTIGVLTKLDRMDAGTNARDILTGRTFPLKLGFVGLVNRSQQDIVNKKPMADAIQAEQLFFQNHEAYSIIAPRCGTAYLTKRLNTILVNHIREKLPDLRSKLSAMIGQAQHELTQYGDPAFMGSVQTARMDPSTRLAAQGSQILKLLTMFSSEFVASIDGTSSDISTKELSGGARIYYIFNNVFGHALDLIRPCANLTNDDIRTAIRNSTGPRCSLFVPELAFDLLVRPQIKLLEVPSLQCVERAFNELSKICNSCGTKELLRYPKLHAKLVEVVAVLLQERLEPTASYVKSLIAIECAYINTNHPDFAGAAGAMAELQQQQQRKATKTVRKKLSSHGELRRSERAPTVTSIATNHTATTSNPLSSSPKDSFLNYFFGGPGKNERGKESSTMSPQMLSSEIEHELEKQFASQASLQDEHTRAPSREDLEVQLIRTLITSYFNIVRKSIQDLVPKSVMHLLVNCTRESVQNRLVSSLYREELFTELLQEDPAIGAERERCRARLESFKKAFAIINDAM